ncbi:hypothetical protein PG985_014983 [Apiospora marii]|uniref:uncharacterized protein n=1 Tax=Apiospora marii TaxID=335849 RepID=UPI00313278BB
MPQKGGRRGTRRHSRYHRRRGTTPEREHLPTAIVLQGEQWQLAQLTAQAEPVEEFRRRLHDWIKDECLVSAYTPLNEASLALHGGNQQLCQWLGDAVAVEGGNFIVTPERLRNCEPGVGKRVGELVGAHNELVDEIEFLHHELVYHWDWEDTDVPVAVELHDVAVRIRQEAEAFVKDVEKLIAPKQTSSHPHVAAASKFHLVLTAVIVVVVDVTAGGIVFSLALLLLRLVSTVLGLLDCLAKSPGLVRDCLQLASHVLACHLAGEPWTAALAPPDRGAGGEEAGRD